MPPFISFITPVYNNERYLPIAVESVLSQGLDNFEYIIVDDASTDETGRIAEELAQKDARIRVIHHSENQWIYAAMNTGLAAAQGEYIYILNSDDALEPGSFARVAELAKQYKPDVVWTRIRTIHCDENQNPIRITNRPTGPEAELPGDFVFYPDVGSVRLNWVNFFTQQFAWNQANLYHASLAKNIGFNNKTFGDDVFFNLGLAPLVESAVLYKPSVYRFYVYNKGKGNASLLRTYGYEHQLYDDFYMAHEKLFTQWGVLNELALAEMSKLRWHQFKVELRKIQLTAQKSLDECLFSLFNTIPVGPILESARLLACEEELQARILSKCKQMILIHPCEKLEKMSFVVDMLDAFLRYEKTQKDVDTIQKSVNHILNPSQIGVCFLRRITP